MSKSKRILALALSLVLISSVYVTDARAEGGDSGTASFQSSADTRAANWLDNGRSGKTTLFIGDSFFDGFWADFYETYAGKDVQKSGISATTANDWTHFIDTFFIDEDGDGVADKQPKNIVMHLGTNDICDDKDDASVDGETTIADLTTMFDKLHERLPDTKVYYFGISPRSRVNYENTSGTTIDLATIRGNVNNAIETKYGSQDWFTFIATEDLIDPATDLKDGVHLYPAKYSILVDALAATDIEIKDEDFDGITCVVGDANIDRAFDVEDLVRLKKYLEADPTLDCSLDGDLNVSGALDSNDIVRCREMLVGDPSLQVSVSSTDWYKKVKETDNNSAYYQLNKSVRAGRSLEFKIDFGTNIGCSVYAYYPGLDNWVLLGEQGTASYKINATENISNICIRVANADASVAVSDFRVYDIQAYETAEVTDLTITYETGTNSPVFYSGSEKIDLTRFAANTDMKGLSYKWSLVYKYTNGTIAKTVDSLDMTSTSYTLHGVGNYKITATVTTEGYTGSASMDFYVVNPSVNITYDEGNVVNSVTDSTAVVGVYEKDEEKNATGFIDPVNTVTYTLGMGGDTDGALVTNHHTGPYTVVKDYAFGTSNFTISAWINIPEEYTYSTGSNGYLFGTMTPTDSTGFRVGIKDGQLVYKVLSNNGSSSSISIEKDHWYNVAVRRKGTSFEIYFDGALKKTYTIDASADFGTTDLAFGAYLKTSFAYHNSALSYDNVQVYKGALEQEKIKAIAKSYAMVPEVLVNYDGGQVANNGAYSNIKVSSSILNATKSSTGFETYLNNTTFVRGIDGDVEGAISTNHKNGPYTVVEDYNFGADNFTISAWFKKPSGADLQNGPNTYLFGTKAPYKTDAGFAITMKKDTNDNNKYKIAFYDSNNACTFTEVDFTFNEWHNLILRRSGTTVTAYFNGVEIGTSTVAADFSFGKADLAFGAYYGWEYSFIDNTIYFDDVAVYGGALSDKELKNTVSDGAHAPEISINYTGGTLENAGNNQDVALGTYVLNTDRDGLDVYTGTVSYVVGIDGDEKGAISTNHRNGPYTVVRDYKFGKDNFTVSAWFKKPADATIESGAQTYLMGSKAPANGTGFSASIKNDNGVYKVTYRGNADTGTITGEVDFSTDTWHNITITRDGANLIYYLDGTKLGALKVDSTFDFGTADLCFGGHYGVTWNYTNSVIHYDNINVYGGAMSQEEILNHVKEVSANFILL